MVTSGVAPGFVMFRFFEDAIKNGNVDFPDAMLPLTFLCFLLTLGAAYRLAKFNIDTRQSDSFIGLPTPAMSLFVVSLPIIYQTSEIEFVKELVFNNYFLLLVSVVLTVLMNSELKLLALKFKSFGWKGNEYRFVLIILSVVMLTTLQYLAIPLIIIAYLLLSIIQNVSTKRLIPFSSGFTSPRQHQNTTSLIQPKVTYITLNFTIQLTIYLFKISFIS